MYKNSLILAVCCLCLINPCYALQYEDINFPKDQDNIRIIRTYYSLLYKKFGGDRREKIADNDALFDYIDTRYKDSYK